MILCSGEGGAVLQPSSEWGKGRGGKKYFQSTHGTETVVTHRPHGPLGSYADYIEQLKNIQKGVITILTNLANLLCSNRVTIRMRSIAYCSFALLLASLYVQLSCAIRTLRRITITIAMQARTIRIASQLTGNKTKEKHSVNYKNIHGGLFRLGMRKEMKRKAAKKRNRFTLYLHQQISMHFAINCSIVEILVHRIKSVLFSASSIFFFSVSAKRRAREPVIFVFFQCHSPKVVIYHEFFLD